MNDTSRVRGFRPSARRRNRIAAGVALAAIAVGGNVLVYSSLDDAEPAVQAVTDIPAGTEITSDMLRTIDVELDETVQMIPGSQLDLLPGRYAKVRIVSGALLTSPSLQFEPLVTPGHSVVAIRVENGTLPIGLRERSRVQLIVPPGNDGTAPVEVVGRTVGLPVDAGSALGTTSLSVEVAAADAAAIAAADDVRVVLIEPADDDATETGDAPRDDDAGSGG